MGIKVDPTDPQICENCWHMIEPLETPCQIFVYFWEVEFCPGRQVPPNLHVFTCFQDDENPCTYDSGDLPMGWRVTVLWGVAPNDTKIYLWDEFGFMYFRGTFNGSAVEHDVFDNDLVDCDPPELIGGKFGYAMLFWKKAAVQLIEDMNLPTDVKVLMEFFVSDDHKPIYKFCIPKYSMNVKFLLS